MAAKFIQHIKEESLVDFVKETENWLNGEAERQLKEFEESIIRNGSVVNEIVKPAEKVVTEKLTRKHFQMAADTIKAIKDPAKRKELANHHAEIFAKSNPLFDRKRFMQAAAVQESVVTEAQDAHDVYLHGKKIDTVFSNPGSYTAEEMKKSLVNHDGYHHEIEVKTRRAKKAPTTK